MPLGIDMGSSPRVWPKRAGALLLTKEAETEVIQGEEEGKSGWMAHDSEPWPLLLAPASPEATRTPTPRVQSFRNSMLQRGM